MSLARAALRMDAIVEVSRRYGQIIASLSTAATESLQALHGEDRARLDRALSDVAEQLKAIEDDLDQRIADQRLLVP